MCNPFAIDIPINISKYSKPYHFSSDRVYALSIFWAVPTTYIFTYNSSDILS